jgi:hypothetical protein
MTVRDGFVLKSHYGSTAERGALLERCFTTPHTGKVPCERWLEKVRVAGPRHSVLSTDLGQLFTRRSRTAWP